MGQIQSAVQGLVASVATAEVVKGKREQELAAAQEKKEATQAAKEKQAAAQAAKEKQQNIADIKNLPKEQEEIFKLSQEKKKLLQEKKELKEKGLGEKTQSELNIELRMRNFALKTLRGKIQAKKLVASETKARIKAYKAEHGDMKNG